MHKTHRLSRTGVEALRCYEVAHGGVGSHRTDHVGRDRSGDQAKLDLTEAKMRTFNRNPDIACGGQPHTAGVTVPLYPSDNGAVDTPADVPLSALLPAFITSELKTAFQIGFLLFLPFLVIDMVVASVLMSLGMMMLSPMLVAMPFKLLLFVLVDGWTMTVGSLVATYVV